MQRRFIQLVVRARRLVRPESGSAKSTKSRGRLIGRRQIGTELTQFSFRLAFVIDVAYVGAGALGGAAIGRASVSKTGMGESTAVASDVRDVQSPRVPVVRGAVRVNIDSIAVTVSAGQPGVLVR